MKQLILIMSLALSINAYAQQDDQTVTLTVSGQGETMEEAKTNALRSAIEQAFGTFISSKTEILNDELVKDEIVSVANGNIQKFEIISEVQIPDGGYAITLKATVSVSKLTSFVVSKGVVVEFKGGLFAFNINQQILNETNEAKAIDEIINITLSILNKSFYGTISPEEPLLVKGSTYKLPFEIEIRANENINTAVKYFNDNINKLALTKTQRNDYIKLNKPVYEIIIVSPSSPINGEFTYKNRRNYSICPVAIPDYNPADCKFYSLYLRNKLSYNLLYSFLLQSFTDIFQFNITTDNNLILDAEISTLKCGETGRIMNRATGSIPFSATNIRLNSVLDIIIPNSRYLCGGGNNESFPTINKSLAKYFCKRRSTNNRQIPVLIILLHQYQNDGLVYQLFGSSNILLSDLGKMSSIKIEYSKNRLSKIK